MNSTMELGDAIDEMERLSRINADLLAALERTLSWLSSYPGGGTLREGGPYDQARTAIAKARAQLGDKR